MKVSKETLDVLKYFSPVNDGLVLVPGTKQRTITSDQGILIEAEFTEDFPQRAAIGELSKFLANMDMFDEPVLVFDKNTMLITGTNPDERYGVKYAYGSEKLIKTPPDKQLDVSKMSDDIVKLPKDILSKVLKFSAINGLPQVTIGNDGVENYIEAHDTSNPEATKVHLKVESHTGTVWKQTFKTERFSKLIPTDYTIRSIPGTFSVFFGANKVTFFIAAEK